MKYLVFLILIFCFGCQSDNGKSIPSEDSAPDVVEKIADQVSDDIGMDLLTNSVWTIEIVLDNGRINEGNQWTGSQLEFATDGSYKWLGSSVENSGRFSLDLERNIILLESLDSSHTSEWSIKYRKTMMVWVGTPKFSQHSLQLKLVKGQEN